MKKKFKVAFRDSLLSRAQVEIVLAKALEYNREIEFDLIPVQTSGDIGYEKGTGLFTKDLQNSLKNGEADIAIHSLKDVSSPAFFNETQYAVADRDDVRDIAIFNPDIITRVQEGKAIRVGTSSPRRSGMAIPFLKKALPYSDRKDTDIKISPIRGNIDARLKKLQTNEYDGIILAVAGLNRLLTHGHEEMIRGLLSDKKWMILPLFECPPAPGQGAIVLETLKDNTDAASFLEAIDDKKIRLSLEKEQILSSQYGWGCSGAYGVFYMDLPNTSFTFAAGKNGEGEDFTDWKMDINIQIAGDKLFSSTDYMKSFFRSEADQDTIIPHGFPAFFVSSHKAIHSDALRKQLDEKRVWAAGTHTWYELAKMGIWVEGCADGLGLESVAALLASALVGLPKTDIQIVTNKSSISHWKEDGWNSTGTYELIPSLPADLQEKMRRAEMVFWTSFQQYELCKDLLDKNVIHACPAGKTATLLRAKMLSPVVFPTIKAFSYWREKTVNSE